MVDVTSQIRFEIAALDWAARAASADVQGISGGPYGSIVHLSDNANPASQTLIANLLTAFGTLAVNVLPSSIPADDATEASITLNTADPAVDWLLTDAATGDALGQGTEAAVAGVVTLKFKTSIAGVYDIWLRRKTGDFATGSVRVTVTEV